MVKSRPYIIISGAISIDGKIATRSGRSNLSSKEDLIRVHKLRKTVDAILVGRNTITTDNPNLTVRLIKGTNPLRVILDPRGKIPITSKVVSTAKKIPTLLVVLEGTRNVEKFREKGLEVLECGRGKIELRKLLKILKRRGIRRMLIEGGGLTNWHFFKERLVDELMITITPYVLGGNASISLVEGLGFKEVSLSKALKLKNIKKMKNEIFLSYVS